MAQGRQFNSNSNYQVAVWCKLQPGIDPAQWASICRLLGSLSEEEFRYISMQLRMASLRIRMRRLILDSMETWDGLL